MKSGEASLVTDKAAFIRANTRLGPVPLIPEIVMFLADEAVPLWHKTEQEMGETGLPPPFWAFAWAGGQALGRHLLDNPGLVRGKSVLDLASGSGLVAIAALKAGAAEVAVADIDAFARAAAELNAQQNDVTVSLIDTDLLIIPTDRTWDIVLAGDIFYERDTAARAFDFLRSQSLAGATILIGDPGRSYLPQNKLRKIAEYDVPVSRDIEDATLKRTSVWMLAPAATSAGPA